MSLLEKKRSWHEFFFATLLLSITSLARFPYDRKHKLVYWFIFFRSAEFQIKMLLGLDEERRIQLLKKVSISWCVHIAVNALGDLREQLAQHFKCRNASVSAEAQKQLASTQSSCASGASFFCVKGPILQFLTATNYSVINVQIRRETVALMEPFSS